jgi:hypothetical protein
MDEQSYRLILGVLALWRVTHLLQAEDGPWDLLVGLRRRLGEGFWSGLLDCFYCLSLWLSAPLALLLSSSQSWERIVLLWLALSGGAIFLERLGGRTATSYVEYSEEREK